MCRCVQTNYDMEQMTPNILWSVERRQKAWDNKKKTKKKKTKKRPQSETFFHADFFFFY